MSIFDCIQRAMDAGEADRERGERAQRMWREMADRYERQGHTRQNAEALAAEDLRAMFRKEAGDMRHVYQARLAKMREAQAQVAAASAPNMTDKLEVLDYQHRGIMRWANGRLGQFLREHHRDLLGRVRNPVRLTDIVKALHGEAVDDPLAKAMADSVAALFEDMRLQFNAAGGIIPKLDTWGLPHSHSRRQVTKAGFDRWAEGIDGKLDWRRIRDPLTDRPMQAENGPLPPREARMSFLREVYDNIAFGKESRDAVYGRPRGTATYKKHAERRILHFRSGEDWLAYNREFGSGDPFAAIMGHVHRMARDIVLLREFGPNPGLGVEYYQQVWQAKARGDEALTRKVQADSSRATRMFRVLSGGSVAETAMQDAVATFMSSTRHVLTAAFLDRAIVASISDLNSMRLAASAVGMNPENLISRHVRLMADSMSREDAMRAGYVADTMADAGTVLARFQQEVAPAEWAERLASASMRIQGLTHWTDQARIAFQMEFAGLMAANAGRKLADVQPELRAILQRRGITEGEWAELTRPEALFTTNNGATFASPFWWRENTDLSREQADALFFKIQGIIEEQMEYAVPTQSLIARAYVDPAAYDIPPGTVIHELMKSGTMFKSFAMTFTINQYRRIMSQPTVAGRIGYAVNLAAGATVLGALAIQLGDMGLGRDPQDMTDPNFWGRAALKGGGFGIIGDIVTTGEATWQGGFPSYVAGPVPQAVGDVWNLTVGNMIEAGAAAMRGEEIDTNLAAELARMGRRYTPMGQTPLVGPALDRMFWDQLQMVLDPDAQKELERAATRRNNLVGGGNFWMPGQALPSRAPDLGNALGN